MISEITYANKCVCCTHFNFIVLERHIRMSLPGHSELSGIRFPVLRDEGHINEWITDAAHKIKAPLTHFQLGTDLIWSTQTNSHLQVKRLSYNCVLGRWTRPDSLAMYATQGHRRHWQPGVVPNTRSSVENSRKKTFTHMESETISSGQLIISKIKTYRRRFRVYNEPKLIITASDICRHNGQDHFVYAPNQWETTLQCNVASHWLNAYTKWSMLSGIQDWAPCIRRTTFDMLEC